MCSFILPDQEVNGVFTRKYAFIGRCDKIAESWVYKQKAKESRNADEEKKVPRCWSCELYWQQMWYLSLLAPTCSFAILEFVLAEVVSKKQ